MNADLDNLLARVRICVGPDRELDADIATLEGWREIEFHMSDINGSTVQVGLWMPASADDDAMSEYVSSVREEVRCNLWRDYDDYPAYTASIDAALALTERVLPGLCGGVSQNVFHLSWNAWLGDQNEGEAFTVAEESHDISAPLAIIAATLQALIAKDTQP